MTKEKENQGFHRGMENLRNIGETSGDKELDYVRMEYLGTRLGWHAHAN